MTHRPLVLVTIHADGFTTFTCLYCDRPLSNMPHTNGKRYWRHYQHVVLWRPRKAA